jgi:hypothetical protein
MTDGFTESPFVRKNSMMLLLQVWAFGVWIAVVWAWLKGRVSKS